MPFLRDLSNPREGKWERRKRDFDEIAESLIKQVETISTHKKASQLRAVETLSENSKNFTTSGEFNQALSLVNDLKNDKMSRDVHVLTTLQALERNIINNQKTHTYSVEAKNSMNLVLDKLRDEGTGELNLVSEGVNSVINDLQTINKDVESNMYLANEKNLKDDLQNTLDMIQFGHLLNTHAIGSEEDGTRMFDDANFNTAENFYKAGDYGKAETNINQALERKGNRKWETAGTILSNNTKQWVRTNSEIKTYLKSKDTEEKIKTRDKEGMLEYIDYVDQWGGSFTTGDLQEGINRFGGTFNAAMTNSKIKWDSSDPKQNELKKAYESGQFPEFSKVLKDRVRIANGLDSEARLYDEQIRSYIHTLGIGWIGDTGFYKSKGEKELERLGAEMFADMFFTVDDLYEFNWGMYGGRPEYPESDVYPMTKNASISLPGSPLAPGRSRSGTGDIFPK